MKVIVLAGGRGTRLAEETATIPKPMVEIGGKPIIWHIMKIYSAYGFNDFLIACGYKGEIIKEYFNSYFVRNSDFFVDLRNGKRDIIETGEVDWRVGLIDTGPETQTGGRILRLRKWVGEETFMVTYGDGLSNLNMTALLAFHRKHGKMATVTAVRPSARFGGLILGDHDTVLEFSEKPQMGEGWINGGFFVFEPGVFDYITDDNTILERDPLERLAVDNQFMAYRHTGFWQPMDTLREKQILDSLWAKGEAHWKTW